MKSKKLKYVECVGNTIIVKTPNPYKSVKQYPHETDKQAEDKAYLLNQSCAFLYDTLRVLGISKKRAIEEDYTLNTATGEKLIRIAANKGVSNIFYKTIREYNW